MLSSGNELTRAGRHGCRGAGTLRGAGPGALRWTVRDVKLFGSYARGEAHEGSDLDVLIVVDALNNVEGREIAHLAGDVLTEFGLLISAFTQSTESWQALRDRERLIVSEIDREGVPL
jgi:predicted nucleotidyltransferase